MSNKKLSPYLQKKARQKLEDALRAMPNNRLACRGRMHAWAVDEDFHVYNEWQEPGRKTPHIRRVFGCMRGCGVRVIEHYIATRSGEIERISRTMDYSGAVGYLVPGIPRGLKPLHIIQQEEYRRAMEKVAKAHRGDTQAAEGDRYARKADAK